MSGRSYTKGPWEVNGLYQIVLPNHLSPIATVIMPSSLRANGEHNENYEANAHLIAAAPDLLDALEALVKLDGEWSNDAYANAERVIAKAKGKAA